MCLSACTLSNMKVFKIAIKSSSVLAIVKNWLGFLVSFLIIGDICSCVNEAHNKDSNRGFNKLIT